MVNVNFCALPNAIFKEIMPAKFIDIFREVDHFRSTLSMFGKEYRMRLSCNGLTINVVVMWVFIPLIAVGVRFEVFAKRGSLFMKLFLFISSFIPTCVNRLLKNREH